MKILRVEKYNRDCNPNKYYFINNDSIMCFFQTLNCDLVMLVNTYNIEKEVVFSIKKEENKEVYDLITKMLNNIEEMKFIKELNRTLPEYDELFKNGYFSWKSDAPANEDDWNKSVPFIYNYLNIKSLENEYQLIFINNINKNMFSVEVNTDRSRYGMIRFEVFDFFKNLENVINQVSSYEDIRQLIKKNTR